MIVYIVMSEPYHDNGCILGVYDSLEKAEHSCPKENWLHTGYYCNNNREVVSENDRKENEDDLLIYKKEVQ